jgi:hypothetical protein
MQGRLGILVSGLRRFFILLAGLAGGTTVLALVLALLAHWSVDRAVAIAFDLVGVFFLVVGFFVGNRGPVRLKGEASVPLFGQRRMRWASPSEREESLSDSAVFVAVGLVMVVIGIAIDSRYQLV